MMEAAPNENLQYLLDYLRRTRAFDFSAYKAASLQRRVDHRLRLVGVDGYTDYVDYLEVHPDEFRHLFNTVLINVTDFFRVMEEKPTEPR
jgi:two-component system, chemotaxis family, CheB/CheR fusion protein